MNGTVHKLKKSRKILKTTCTREKSQKKKKILVFVFIIKHKHTRIFSFFSWGAGKCHTALKHTIVCLGTKRIGAIRMVLFPKNTYFM